MKAVIYFSLEGNTAFLAKKIAEKMGADLIELEPEKKYSKGNTRKYIFGGLGILFARKPKLKNDLSKLSKYNTVVLGSPVWVNSYAPPLSTLMLSNVIKAKKIGLFASHMGGGADGCFEKFKKNLNGAEVLATLDFVNPLKADPKVIDEKVEEFTKKLL